MRKWYYHPESDTVYLGEESEEQKSPEFGLLTEICSESLVATEQTARKLLIMLQGNSHVNFDNLSLKEIFGDDFDDGEFI